MSNHINNNDLEFIDSDNEEEDVINDDFDLKLDKLRKELHENYIEQKQLMDQIQQLLTSHKISLSSNKSKIVPKIYKFNDFNKLEKIPPSLRKLLKIENETMTKMDITKLLYEYFKENKMYDKKTKTKIIPNNQIKKIFNIKNNEEINFYNLQMWINKLY